MTGRSRRLDRALDQFRSIHHEISSEIALSRVARGLSQDEAGAAVGLSGSQFGRIERGELRGVSVEQWCRASAAVGLKLHVRAYPDGDPVRDIAHVRLLERFRSRVPGHVGWRSEVPLHGRSDARSWDATVDLESERDAVEAETRIRDGQAVWRRVSLKLRDDVTVGHVFLLVADTPGNRRAIASVRDLLRPDLPLDTRQILAAVGRGRCPGASGIVFL